jgi:hypothetical protein
MRKLIISITTLGLTLLFLSGAFADEGKVKTDKKEEKSRALNSVEMLTGFSWGKVQTKDTYNMIPVSLAFNFDIKPLAKKIKLNLKQALQFQIEPFFGFISQPDSNVEFGNSFWIKMGLVPDNWKLQPYVKGGVGFDYMTQHTREQGTQFNFIEHVGGGIQYSLTKNTSLIIEGRWRHLSNCSIKDPNHGINTYFALTGISYKF